MGLVRELWRGHGIVHVGVRARSRNLRARVHRAGGDVAMWRMWYVLGAVMLMAMALGMVAFMFLLV